MTQPILDCSNANYWQEAYTVDLVAAQSVPGYFVPIPRHRILTTFNSHTLAVGASSFRTRPNWKLGFWLSMLVNLAGVGWAVAEEQAIPLGLKVIRFSAFSPQFQLSANIPKWHEEMSIKIWEYSGPETDVLNLQQQTQLKLDQIETKIDQL